jgi:hypothetical protein
MDYNKIRFELYKTLKTLSWHLDVIIDDKSIYTDLRKNNLQEIVCFSNEFYTNINLLHKLSTKYKIDDFKCIDFECVELSNEEIIYVNNNSINKSLKAKNSYVEGVKKINNIFVSKIDKIKKMVLESKFYFDNNYKLSSDEFNFTVLLYYNVWLSCEVTQREKLGYVLKMLLCEYDYKLFRNAFNLFFDIHAGYPDYIKGEFKFVKTFDENKYEYMIKPVHNEFYPDEYKLKPVEDFERRNIFSKYEQIQQLIQEQKNNPIQ